MENQKIYGAYIGRQSDQFHKLEIQYDGDNIAQLCFRLGMDECD